MFERHRAPLDQFQYYRWSSCGPTLTESNARQCFCAKHRVEITPHHCSRRPSSGDDIVGYDLLDVNGTRSASYWALIFSQPLVLKSTGIQGGSLCLICFVYLLYSALHDGPKEPCQLQPQNPKAIDWAHIPLCEYLSAKLGGLDCG